MSFGPLINVEEKEEQSFGEKNHQSLGNGS